MKKEWQTRKLGDVCNLLNRGISPKYLEEGGVCVLNEKCIRNHQIDYELSRRHDLSTKKVDKKRFIQLGDVLVNSTGTGTLGRVAQIREEPFEPTTVDSHVTIVRPKTEMFHLDFFGYMLILIEDAIKEAGEGCGGQTELARSALAEKFLVSFPESLSEQQRIVAILDKAFEGIAIAKVNAEKNLQNARVVCTSHLKLIFAQHGEGWKLKPLGELCHLISGQHIDAKDYNTDLKGIGYLTGPSDFGVINPIVTKWTEFPKRMAKQGDILITVKGSVGKINLLNIEEVAISRQLMAVRAMMSDVDYLYAFLSINIDYFQSCSKGAAIPGISREDVLDLMCPMPSPEEKQAIVNLIHAIADETQRLESIYQRKLSALEALKKSLLAQAFTGNL